MLPHELGEQLDDLGLVPVDLLVERFNAAPEAIHLLLQANESSTNCRQTSRNALAVGIARQPGLAA
ncbi:hypothetical protein ACIBTP_39935 [Streptomyces avidinii]|uniref:hypothetical protein n=1 Tax=Streptomyces avidinii TaxID=1895 RepID=UPI00379FA8A1